MVIEDLAIWVTELHLTSDLTSDGWMATGIPFDGNFGFGGEDKRDFSGKAILLSLDKIVTEDLSINIIHVQRQGILWWIEAKRLIKTPFLVTSNLKNHIIFNGYVNIDFTQQAREVSERYGNDYVYPIAGKNWFGILTKYKNNKDHILAFSSQVVQKVEFAAEEEELTSLEWDWVLGSLKGVI